MLLNAGAVSIISDVNRLAYLASALHLIQSCGYGEIAVEVYGREYHTVRFLAHHLAGLEVGNEEHTLAHKLLGLVPLSYARQDGAVLAATIVQSELEQFLALLDFFFLYSVIHC